jgi:phage-related protein
VGGEFVDLTKEQFVQPIDYADGAPKTPSMDKNNAQERYDELLKRVEENLRDN